MQRHELVRRTKLAAVLFAAALFGSFLIGARTGADATLETQEQAPESQEIPQNRLNIFGYGVPLAERVGDDDGAAFVIHFTGDMHGSLEPCG
ncbi:MAG TPA: hypothetical protein VJQ56_15775 [Blastocatellia bacterium]|nr:hypothetical protein [Blastocatellia bacterium]